MNKADYDVFLSHNSIDKPAVEELAKRLSQNKFKPWFDKWNLIPGDPWQVAIESALDRCATCAVFLGPSGISPWQNEEMRAAIGRRVREGNFRVIPVLLPGAEREKRSRLPSFMVAATWVEFRKSLDDNEAFRCLVAGIRGIEPGPGFRKSIAENKRPYRGLETFRPEHAPFFFGREALTEWLLNELKPSFDLNDPNRFLAIIGASGSGKSSLALAGLIPALRQGAIDESNQWPILIFRPGQDPLESIAVALHAEPAVREFIPSVIGIISDFIEDRRTLHRIVREALHKEPETRRIVVFIDQFEEIFTLCQEDSLRMPFIENVLYASNVVRGKTLSILTMRADFYSKCASYETLAAALSDHQVLVGPMTEAELRRTIQRPAQLLGCELEDGLVEALIKDFNNQPGALPLLQHALFELWDRREGRRLTHDAYHSIGKLEGALENYANSVFEKFNEYEQEVCRRIFLRLAQPGEGTEDTKRRASLKDLIPADAEDEPTFRVIHDLADSRLITTEGEKDRPGDGFVEVAHEALIRGWSKLRTWLDSDREALRIHRRLSDTALEWAKAGHDESYLYRGVRLAEAEEWKRLNAQLMNSFEQEFLQKSIALQDREVSEEKTRQKKLRRRVFVATVAAGAALLAAFISIYAFYQAQNQREIAKSRALALEAIETSDPHLSVHLSLEAFRMHDTKEARRALLESVRYYKEQKLGLLPFSYLCCADDELSALTFTEDGKGLFSVDVKGKLMRWDLATERPYSLSEPLKGGVLHIRTTDSGKSLVVVSTNEISFFNLDDKPLKQEPVDFPFTEISSAVLSTDGSRLAIGDREGRIALMHLREKKWSAPMTNPKLKDAVTSLAFHPTEALLAASYNIPPVKGFKHTIVLWNVITGSRLDPPFVGHRAEVVSLSFSPDGKQLASGSWDGDVRLWDFATRKLIPPVLVRVATGSKRITDRYTQVEIHPDGEMLFSFMAPSKLNSWDMANHKILMRFDFGVNGTTFAVSSNDKLVAIGMENKSIILIPTDFKYWLREACELTPRSLSVEEKFYYLLESRFRINAAGDPCTEIK